MRTLQPLLAAALVVAAFLPSAGADEVSTSQRAGIQWFATWDQASKEARRTQRPILLIAAAPHCKNISGVW